MVDQLVRFFQKNFIKTNFEKQFIYTKAELYNTSLDYLTCFTDEIKPYPRKK